MFLLQASGAIRWIRGSGCDMRARKNVENSLLDLAPTFGFGTSDPGYRSNFIVFGIILPHENSTISFSGGAGD